MRTNTLKMFCLFSTMRIFFVCDARLSYDVSIYSSQRRCTINNGLNFTIISEWTLKSGKKINHRFHICIDISFCCLFAFMFGSFDMQMSHFNIQNLFLNDVMWCTFSILETYYGRSRSPSESWWNEIIIRKH